MNLYLISIPLQVYRVTRPKEAVITDKLNLKFELAGAGAGWGG